jgi:streptogramin lyase
VSVDAQGEGGITVGRGENVWYTTSNGSSGSIGRISPSGTFTTFTGTGTDFPHQITAGPDGNIWFTNYGNNTIGRITPSGVVTDFSGPGISGPEGITVGPDKALWFTNHSSASIGRITTKITPNLAASPPAGKLRLRTSQGS